MFNVRWSQLWIRANQRRRPRPSDFNWLFITLFCLSTLRSGTLIGIKILHLDLINARRSSATSFLVSQSSENHCDFFGDWRIKPFNDFLLTSPPHVCGKCSGGLTTTFTHLLIFSHWRTKWKNTPEDKCFCFHTQSLQTAKQWIKKPNKAPPEKLMN